MPSLKCVGDIYFIVNLTEYECDNCKIPASDVKIYEFYENTTAVGYCKENYEGVLCTECKRGFGTNGNFKCADCSEPKPYVKQIFLFIFKISLFAYMNWISQKRMKQ